ncbi:MAG: LUD domain-containing protein [Deltaproteobacteria bacterium]|nr:LUD domain-containing protein [Deltaproteobacteria bacterium]
MSHGRMRDASREKLVDRSVGDKVHRATLRTLDKREHMVETIPDWEALRKRAREIRLEALDRHDELREELIGKLRERGVHVTVVQTVEDAQRTIASLVRQIGKRVTKSKSMASEEILLNDALEAEGAQVTETDLGELIVQLAHQPPSHVTAPAIHLSVEDIARIFHDKLDIEPPDWVKEGRKVDEATRVNLATQMSLAARKVLRDRFLGAEVGISGANFLVAQSGTVVLLENEGNIQLTTCLPKRHIVLAGLDKIIPRDEDLSVLLRLLPVSATAQRQTCYVSLFADAHPDMHVVLLDHGRTKLMKDPEQRDVLTCIRCGACLNACPVYRNVGGHAYGGAYPGPIGALLLPHLAGFDRYGDLPFASSLCGACTEICPVAIPLHERLLQLRARLTEQGHATELGWTLGAATELMKSEPLMRAATWAYRFGRPLAPIAPAARAWLHTRDLPEPPEQSFSSWYQDHRGDPSTQEPQKPRQAPSRAAKPRTSLPMQPTQSPLDRFRKRLKELGPSGETELHCFATAVEARHFLRKLMEVHPPEAVLVEGERSTKKDYALGITSAALWIADTGGLLLDLKERAAGRASTLVDTHVVVAHKDAHVDTLAEAMRERVRRRAGRSWGDYQVIVTGPSRTADIEKVLVIPAHGPRRLIVVICDEVVSLKSL